jgi:hypothetical protein
VALVFYNSVLHTGCQCHGMNCVAWSRPRVLVQPHIRDPFRQTTQHLYVEIMYEIIALKPIYSIVLTLDPYKNSLNGVFISK